ncbi:hypothetical protein DHW03_13985 [Pedobacter yonginense]|uniref:Uncharacterized protein n=1 Tax=Pedobacter yonginense TaxID=651869 RepID=A0A317EJV0_9SPHI|nr:hypothetical protein [Pedobacter yonginense]PWS27110.1 hypothetical protein DHW03_13985 [Pedobacter yonginense]
MFLLINECSLDEQYQNEHEFREAMQIFISALDFIAKLDFPKEVYKSNTLFNHTGVTGLHLNTFLKNNHDLNQLFVGNLQRLGPTIWDKTHDSNSTYHYNTVDYVETSPAELTERRIVNAEKPGFLFNFFKSNAFSESVELSISKNSTINVEVDCNFDIDTIYNWLVENGLITPSLTYDETSKLSPLDQQTVLNDTTKFTLTKLRNQGRKVYNKVGSGELWVVDNSRKHAGTKAHIEVFDENTKEHLGTSLYNKDELDKNFKVPNRKL